MLTGRRRTPRRQHENGRFDRHHHNLWNSFCIRKHWFVSLYLSIGQYTTLYKPASTNKNDNRYPYSYFSAVIGDSVAAPSAGYRPESSPINVAKTSAKMGSHSGVETATDGGGAPVCTDCPAR